MLSSTASGYRFLVPPSAPAEAPAPDPGGGSCAWYDAECHALDAAESVKDWFIEEFIGFFAWLGDQIVIGLGYALPTLAAAGIIWWMCPFFPKHQHGAKLTGLSLILYMFYVLIVGVG